MYPKWLYCFNHYLMLVSLGGLVLLTIVGLASLFFVQTMPMPMLEWWCDFFGWTYTILFVLLVVSSGVFVKGFSKHRLVIKKDEEETK